MNYKYIYPLFEYGDEEDAESFIVDNLIQNTQHAELDPKSLDYDIMAYMIKRSVCNAYGVNITLMANFFMVQKIVMENYIPHILKYLSLSRYNNNVDVMHTCPSDILLVTNKFATDFSGPCRWSPNRVWTDFKQSDNPIDNILNPLNGTKHIWLTIQSDPKVIDLMNSGLDAYGISRSISEDAIRVKIGPSSSYNRIMTITKLIHKYF